MISIQEQQPQVAKWLRRVVRTGRMAHAYLFVGKKGSGKKQMATFFAQSLFCEDPAEFLPCLKCANCRRTERGNHPDIHWLRPEGASIKIDQVRMLQKEFSYRGHETNRKVYIMEQVETITRQAANSLLKFLEEPHPGAVAILLSQNRHQILPTILSRCQEIRFQPPSPRAMVDYLASTETRALAHSAAHITTDLEEATSLCQAEWFAELRNIVIQLTQEIHKRSSKAIFMIQDDWLKTAKEKEQIDIGLDLLLLWYTDLLYTKLKLEDKRVYIDQDDQLRTQGLAWSEERLTEGIERILSAKARLHANVNSQLLLEQLVFRLQEG